MQEKSPRHLAALSYAAMGIAIFPCVVNGKEPAGHLVPRGFLDASADPEQINKWWLIDDWNIGVEPERMELCVADQDAGADLPFPPTYTVRTPRGGRHFYFKGTLPPSSDKLAKGWDTRGIGGYVLVAPSYVIDEKKGIDGPYEIIDGREPAELPTWVAAQMHVEKVAERRATSGADLDHPATLARALAIIKREPPGLEGERDQHGYDLAAKLLDYVRPEVAEQIMIDHWQVEGDFRQGSREEYIAEKVANAAKNRQNKIGCDAYRPPEDRYGLAARELMAQFKREGPKTSRFHFEDEDEQENAPPPSWLVPDLIPADSTVLLVGETGTMKSFVALDIGLSVAYGVPTFGAAPSQTGKVFYGALEGRSALKSMRRKAWRLARSITASNKNFMVGRAPILEMGQGEEFVEQVKVAASGEPVRLIILDTYAKIMAGRDENDALTAALCCQFLHRLLDEFPGCSVVLIAHKSNKAGSSLIRGSSALQSDIDTTISVSRPIEKGPAIEVAIVQHKDAEEREQPWTFEAIKLGGSLALQATTPAQHVALVSKDDPYHPSKVGAALRRLGMILPKTCPTEMLAGELHEKPQQQSPEERQEEMAGVAKRLLRLAKGPLQGYCNVANRWGIPE